MADLIFVEQKPMEGREHNLSPGDTIGREGCEVVLPDPEVSRRHAAIREEGGSLAIEDLGSTNGTYVNDRRVHGVQALKDGDVVRLGNTVWSIKAAAPAAGATSIGQVQAEPQVTAARAIPTDIQVPSSPPPPAAPPAPAPQATTAQAVPAAAAAAPQQPAAPSAPTPQQVGPRGDVPAPPEVTPSAIRRTLPAGAVTSPPAFTAPGARPGGSAATRVEATIVCLIIAALVAVGLVIYFVTY